MQFKLGILAVVIITAVLMTACVAEVQGYSQDPDLGDPDGSSDSYIFTDDSMDVYSEMFKLPIKDDQPSELSFNTPEGFEYDLHQQASSLSKKTFWMENIRMDCTRRRKER